jgi:hypothetical protein
MIYILDVSLYTTEPGLILFQTDSMGEQQMAQLLRQDHQRKTERNKDVIRMLSNARNKTSF